MRIILTCIIAILLFSTCKKDEEIYTVKNVSVVGPMISDTIYSLTVFPNPCDSFINLKITLPKASSVKISIYNPLGRLVYQSTTTIQLAAGQSTIGIDIHTLPKGMYIMRCEFGLVIITKKIIKA